MMTVLHSIDTSGPGGAETVLLNIAAGLDSFYFRSVVVLSGRGWLFESLRKAGIEPIVVSAKGSWNVSYLWQLVSVIRKFRVDVIHSHLFGSNVYCSLAGILTNVPAISTFHGFVDAGANSLVSELKFAIINRGSKKVVFVSNQLREHYVAESCINPESAKVIYNGVDTKKFSPGRRDNLRTELRLKENDIIVGSIGNIRPAKGYDLLLRSAARVIKNRSDIKFVIAGQGSGGLYEGLLSLRRELQLESTVFFLGLRGDTVDLYRNFDIFVLPSTSEGFSISTIEALACGVPAIVTRSGGPEEIVDHMENGLLIEPNNETGLAQAVVDLAMDSLLRKRLQTAGPESVRGRFDISKMINQYEKQYIELVH